MTRPAEGPGTPQREMVTFDRIRLTGLLRKSPVLQGFSMSRFAGDSSGSPRGGLTAVSVEPLGPVARRGLVGFAGYEPLRVTNASRARSDRGPWRGRQADPAFPCSREPSLNECVSESRLTLTRAAFQWV